jgi:GT2 family glycosyltransferase
MEPERTPDAWPEAPAHHAPESGWMASMTDPPVRIALGIATKGRADVLLETLHRLRRQSRYPDRIIVCGTGPDDVAGLESLAGVEILSAPAGLCRQRNAILATIADCDFVLFIDDDFFLAPAYIEATLAAFASDPAIVVTTGHVVADGIVGPGFTVARGDEALRDDPGSRDGQDAPTGESPGPVPNNLLPAWNGYGCNMALRLKPVRDMAMTFDERLPMYAWFEDVDFTRRLGRFGRIVKVSGARGVHLGVKLGRTSGKRLGYSQIANPIYLARKGSYTWPRVVRDLSRHLLVNVVKSLRPEPYIDRRGRLWGNTIGLIDLVRRRLRPERILEL